MPVRANAQDATTKWVNNLSAATTAMTNGVNSVTRAPGAAAAAQSQKWIQRVTASQDKWKSRVGSVTLQQWQNSMTTIGIPRVAQGAQAKQGKYQDFLVQFLPYLQTGVSKVDAMPSTTLEDNIARAVAMIRHNASFKRSGSGGSGA